MKNLIVLGKGEIYRECVKLADKKYENKIDCYYDPKSNLEVLINNLVKPIWLISVQHSSIIPLWILQRFDHNAFNLHNADTQHYRGSHCIDWEIYNKEPKHAVTIHWMTEKVDLGPIVFAEWIPIERNDTPESLWKKSVPVAVKLFGKLLDYIVEGKEIPKIEVDPKIGKFYKKGDKPDTR